MSPRPSPLVGLVTARSGLVLLCRRRRGWGALHTAYGFLALAAPAVAVTGMSAFTGFFCSGAHGSVRPNTSLPVCAKQDGNTNAGPNVSSGRMLRQHPGK